MGLLRIWILHVKLNREIDSLGQYIAEWDIDLGGSVDSPSVGIEYGCQVALAQLEPGNEHRRAGNDQDDSQNDEDELPEAELDESAEDGYDARAQHAESHADGCKDTRELGDVEASGLLAGLLGGGSVGKVGRLHLGCLGIELGSSVSHHGILLFGSELVDLLADEVRELAIGAPHGLLDGNGVVDDIHNLGIVIHAIDVVEDTVLAYEEVTHLTYGNCSNYLHGLASRFADTVAGEQIHARLSSLGSHGSGVVHAYAHVTGTLIDNKCAGLEDGPLLGIVEVLQGDVVAQQGEEIAGEVKQFID